MKSNLVKFKVTPKENEQIEAIIKVPKEKRSVIHGIVVDCEKRPIKDAVVKLLILKDPEDPRSICPISHAFTDEYGQFLFGPLCPNKCYIIKVWYNDVIVKPMVICPDPSSDYCLDCDDHHGCTCGDE